MVVDIKTLMICNLTVILLFCVAFALHSANHKTYPGFKLWTTGLFFHAVALVLFVSRGIIPMGFSVVATHMLFTCAILLRLDGLTQFLQEKPMQRMLYSLPFLVLLISCYFYYVDDNIALRGFILCSLYALLCIPFLQLLIRHAPAGPRSLYYLGAVLIGLRIFSLEGRAIEWISNYEASLFDTSSFYIVNVFIAFLSEIGLNLVFLMINLQRGEANLEKKNSELLDSNNRYKSLSETAFEGVAIAENGIIVEANEHLVTMLGYSGDDLRGKQGVSFIAPEYRDLARFNRHSEFEKKYEVRGLRKDQSTFPIELHGNMFSYHGRQARIISIRDLTEQKRSEQAILERKTLYEFLFENNTSVMLIVDPQTQSIVDANKSACHFYGYTKEQLLSMLITDINVMSTKEHIQEMEKAQSEEKSSFYFRHRLADDSLVEVEVFNGPVYFEGRSLLCSIVLDVTQRKIEEAEKEKLISELQNAVKEISTLRGILPICSYCKSIRNDKGSWDQIESYIRQHSDLEFSHGICPDCVKKLYPEFSASILQEDEMV